MLSLIRMFLEITAFQLTKWNVTGSWWRYQMEIFCALLAICAGNSPVTGEFPAQRPVTRSFDVFFDLRLNKRLSKRWWGWWFETPLHPLWRHCNDTISNDATQGLRRHELRFFSTDDDLARMNPAIILMVVVVLYLCILHVIVFPDCLTFGGVNWSPLWPWEVAGYCLPLPAIYTWCVGPLMGWVPVFFRILLKMPGGLFYIWEVNPKFS